MEVIMYSPKLNQLFTLRSAVFPGEAHFLSAPVDEYTVTSLCIQKDMAVMDYDDFIFVGFV